MLADDGMFGCVDICMFGCVDVWMCGCLDAWVLGCVGAWMFGCVGAWMCLPKVSERIKTHTPTQDTSKNNELQYEL